MRKIIFGMNMSLDGFIEGPNKELDWSIADAELHDYYANLLNEADLIIFGRLTYQLMADYWPTAPSDPHTSPSERRFANALNPMRKIVYSKTLKNVDWNTQVMDKFDPLQIQALREQEGRPILIGGGASMANVFIEHGLVDEYRLMIHPVAIGRGKPLFGGITKPVYLELVSSQRLSSGAVALCYRSDGKV